MTTWKLPVKVGTSDPKIKISKAQIAIIKISRDAYVFVEGTNASLA